GALRVPRDGQARGGDARGRGPRGARGRADRAARARGGAGAAHRGDRAAARGCRPLRTARRGGGRARPRAPVGRPGGARPRRALRAAPHGGRARDAVKISVLCFDLADNAAGRAFLLARLLEPLGEVEIVGPCHGAGIWRPIEGAGIAWRSVPGGKLPGFAASLVALARQADGDLLYASKPRLGSVGVGFLARARVRRPLLLDV